MKKILFIGAAVAIAMGFSSCQKENVTDGQASGRLIKETFSAGFEQTATKTTIDDNDATKVNWSANDIVYYYSADGGTVRSFTIPAAGASASLTLEREDGDTYYNLVYAGNSEPTFTTKTGTSMVFEGVKSAQDGTFRSANISVGRTTPGGNGITFKPITALVKFTTARTDIKTIVLTGGNGNEKVAGNISVDPTAASPVTVLNGDGSTSITVTIGTPAAGTYYINVLPGTYANGLKLTLKDDSGAEIGTLTASKNTVLSAGNSMINYGDIDSHFDSPTYIEGSYSGKGIRIGDIWWAPVNCGYDSDHTYGLLYQWGRKYGQGYDGETPAVSTQNSQLSTVAAGSDLSNKDNFYYGDACSWTSASAASSDDWFTTYNPCPSGWRVPTYDELNALFGGNKSGWTENVGGQNGYYFNGTGSCSSSTAGDKVFLPAVGGRDGNEGSVVGRGDFGGYWSSSGYYEGAGSLCISSDSVYVHMGYYYRAMGFSVRCVQE